MKTYEDIKDHLFDGSLCRADLSDLDLDHKKDDLHRTNLRGANLRDTNLSAVDLRWADLRNADLRGTNFYSTNLGNADLRSADLRSADLREAYLVYTNFGEAKLDDTCLDPRAPILPIYDWEIENAGLEIDGDRVLGWRTAFSQHAGSTIYVPRDEPYIAPVFSISRKECHPGIYLASKQWLCNQYFGTSKVRCWCWRDELVHYGDKWRAKRIWVFE